MAGNQTKSLQDAIKEQYKKCAKDPVYFMRKYCKIQHPVRGKIPFDLYEFQEALLLPIRDTGDAHQEYELKLAFRPSPIE